MNKKVKLAGIANCLFLERKREAGILDWLKKRKLKPSIVKNTKSLGQYLHKSGKIDFIESKLKIAKNLDSLIKALNSLNEHLKEIREQKISRPYIRNKVLEINNLIKNLQEAKNILNKKEQNKLSNILIQELIGKTTLAGISEPLNENDNSIEDGNSSHPLEENEQEIK